MTNNKGIEIRFIIPATNYHREGFDRNKERESIERLEAALKEMDDYMNHENWEYQNQWFVKEGEKTYNVTYTTSRDLDEREVCIWCGCASRFVDLMAQPFWRCVSDHMKLA